MNTDRIGTKAVGDSRFYAMICILGLFLAIGLGQEALACSSFLVEKGGAVIAGRNLDSQKFTPGVVMVNLRGIEKESRSWSELGYGQMVPNPHLRWVSK